MSEKKEAGRLPDHPDVEDKKLDGIEIQNVGEAQEAQSHNSIESLAEKAEQAQEKLADDQQKPRKQKQQTASRREDPDPGGIGQ